MFGQLGRNLAPKREVAPLRGAVGTGPPTDKPSVVLVYSGEGGAEQLVDYFVLAGPGPYFFFVPAGTYRLAAFEDVRRSFSYEPGVDPSALLRAGTPITALGDSTLDDLD